MLLKAGALVACILSKNVFILPMCTCTNTHTHQLGTAGNIFYLLKAQLNTVFDGLILNNNSNTGGFLEGGQAV